MAWSLSYYNRSNLDLKADELWTNGTLIGRYINEDRKLIGLYSLHDFFVELHYDDSKVEIKEIKGINIDEALMYIRLDDWELK